MPEITPDQENGRQFSLDEIPSEVVGRLEAERDAWRKQADQTALLLADVKNELHTCQRELEEARELFRIHTKHVADFNNELYAIMVDPCAEGEIKVSDMCDALRAAALRDREDGFELADLRGKLEAAEKDTVRLDRLQAHGEAPHIAWDRIAWTVNGCHVDVTCLAPNEKRGLFKTLRDAIDAMSQDKSLTDKEQG